MSIYNPKRRTENGTEPIKFPLSAIAELAATTLDNGKVLTIESGYPSWEYPFEYTENLTFSNDTGANCSCTGISRNHDGIIIPPVYNGKNVINIAEGAFQNNTAIQSVVLPDTITSIRANAFSGCANLKTIKLSSNLIMLGEGCFAGCTSLKTIIIPKISSFAFYIKTNAFMGCSSLTIYFEAEDDTDISFDYNWNPNNCPVVWGFASEFDYLNGRINNAVGVPNSTTDDNGKVLTVVKGSPAWKGKYSEGLAFTEQVNGSICTGIGTCTDTDIIIPPTYGLSVIEIGSEAFRDAPVTSVVIPNTVTAIRFGAFGYASELRSLVIPSSVTIVEDHITYSCDNLTVYCEAESQPSTWNASWNVANRPVVWGYTDDFIDLNKKISDIDGKTIDKIAEIGTWVNGAASNLSTDDGISWEEGVEFFDDQGGTLAAGTISHRIPIEAGDNVTFSNEGNVVKINASGGGGTEIVTTTGSSTAYVATVPSITELKAGVEFTMIPHTVSTSASPTLNVNGLGAKGIRRQSVLSSSVYTGYYTNWLAASKPYRVRYNGTYWIAVDLPKTVVNDLSGRVPTSLGGVPSATASSEVKVLTLPANSTTPSWETPGSSGGSSGFPAEFFPMFAQALAAPTFIDGIDEYMYLVDDYADDYCVFSTDALCFDSLCEIAVTSNSSQFDLDMYNNTRFFLRIYVKVNWNETNDSVYHSAYISTTIGPYESGSISAHGEQEMVNDESWDFEILGVRFALNDYY